jgi:hypothetical protein
MQGLVVMASLKLKVEQRERLYFNKFVYRAVTTVPGAHYTYKVKTIDEYKKEIKEFHTITHRYPMYMPLKITDKMYNDIEILINYINDFEKNSKGTIRREGNNVTFYSNDLDLLKKAYSVTKPLKIYQADVLPDGIKYFKRSTPANFRVHFREAKVNTDIKQDILSYIERTDGAEASSALVRWLKSSNRWQHSWCSKNYFINYNDSSQLTMMHLLFPEVLGKNYKLEQQ